MIALREKRRTYQLQTVVELLRGVPEADVEGGVRGVDRARDVVVDHVRDDVEGFLLVGGLVGETAVDVTHGKVREGEQLLDVRFGAVVGEHGIGGDLDGDLGHVAYRGVDRRPDLPLFDLAVFVEAHVLEVDQDLLDEVLEGLFEGDEVVDGGFGEHWDLVLHLLVQFFLVGAKVSKRFGEVVDLGE